MSLTLIAIFSITRALERLIFCMVRGHIRIKSGPGGGSFGTEVEDFTRDGEGAAAPSPPWTLPPPPLWLRLVFSLSFSINLRCGKINAFSCPWARTYNYGFVLVSRADRETGINHVTRNSHPHIFPFPPATTTRTHVKT